MNKPKKCCYPDCFNCIYVDCRYDGIEKADIIMQDKFDKELEIVDPDILRKREAQIRYRRSEKGKDSTKKYMQSEKGKIAIKKYRNSDSHKKAQKEYMKSEKGKRKMERYRKSENGKETLNRYLRSEKGKEMLKRKQIKKIESGKNAEYCRRYRQKLKERKMIEES